MAAYSPVESGRKIGFISPIHERGKIRDRSFDSQAFRASGLNLVVSAIVHWNTVYLSRAVGYLRQQGRNIPDILLKHVSPLSWEHQSHRHLFLGYRATNAGKRQVAATSRSNAGAEELSIGRGHCSVAPDLRMWMARMGIGDARLRGPVGFGAGMEAAHPAESGGH